MLGNVRDILIKISSRIRREGFGAALQHYFGRVKQVTHQVIYDRWLDRYERNPSGIQYVARLDELAGPPPPPGERLYQAFPRLPCLWAIAALNIDPADYTFVDYGSGRGRLLLTAGQLPFRRVIGVELARSLHDEACENIASYPLTRLKCMEVTSSHTNAIESELPEGNIVAFFFNPFPEDVLRHVANQIAMACDANSRAVRIIFAGQRDRAKIFRQHPSYRSFVPSLANRMRLHALSPVPISFFSVGSVYERLTTPDQK